MSTNQNLHNIRAMVVGATAEFSFSEGAPTAALAGTVDYPFSDFGNLTGVDFQSGIESEKRTTCYRGVRREISTEPTLTKLGYKLKSNEADPLKLAIAFNAALKGDLTQAALTATDCDAIAFASGKPAKIGAWYDLRIAGVHVRNITLVTITGKTEGTDFVVDKDLGRIRFLTALTASVTPAVTAQAITADPSDLAMKKLSPMQQPIRRGFGRITFFDRDVKNKVVLDHFDFSCEVVLDGNGLNSQDGKSATEPTLLITVTDTEGEMVVRS